METLITLLPLLMFVLLGLLLFTGYPVAFGLAGKWLADGINPYRMGGRGILVGVAAFSAVIFAAPLASSSLFFAGALLIGFGGGLFAVATLHAAMTMPTGGLAGRGLALGAWGAAQATAQGLSTAIGGGLRDLVNTLGEVGLLTGPLTAPTTGYSVVYHLEIGLLFLTLAALGPLVRVHRNATTKTEGEAKLGLAEFPT